MKVNASTKIEDEIYDRIKRIADKECSNASVVIRRCIIRELPRIEREVLGVAGKMPDLNIVEEAAV